jgi:diguanylate cyclase (GGDEF)-like protein
LIDLDHFKRVNDAEGHLAGDEILRVMATRVTACAGPNRMVARLGGDEFLVVCNDESLKGAAVLVDLIRTAASEPIDLGHTTVKLGASAGVAFAELGDTCSSLLKRADQALYAAKAARPRLASPDYLDLPPFWTSQL